MNRFTRFLTKKGKKSKAYLFLEKAYTLLAHFEAEKKLETLKFVNSQEISPETLSDFTKNSQKVESNFQTYKSQKLSQFLSGEKKKSLETSNNLTNKIVKKEDFPLSSRILLEQALSHVKPFVEVKKVRVAGSTYQVPAILKKTSSRKFSISMDFTKCF